jgi:hypothetical protein
MSWEGLAPRIGHASHAEDTTLWPLPGCLGQSRSTVQAA